MVKLLISFLITLTIAGFIIFFPDVAKSTVFVISIGALIALGTAVVHFVIFGD